MQVGLSDGSAERTGLEDGLHPPMMIIITRRRRRGTESTTPLLDTTLLRTDFGLQLVQAAQKGAHGLLMPGLDGGWGVDKIASELDGLLLLGGGGGV